MEPPISLLLTRLKVEEDYKVIHRGVHFGTYNGSQVMYENNGHTIPSATSQQMRSTTDESASALEIGVR